MNRVVNKIKGITSEDRISYDLALSSWKEFQKQDPTSMDFDDYVVRGNQIEIAWRHRNNYKIDSSSLDFVSFGICVSKNQKFHLKDMPNGQ
jgi:hypothetical protein